MLNYNQSSTGMLYLQQQFLIDQEFHEFSIGGYTDIHDLNTSVQ